ncbi:MAG TPA: aldose 1-epimerase [Candidatus Binataceae bacterium]|nr:aldose 1-epimerase [Candidatus Binataceae bacterium]
MELVTIEAQAERAVIVPEAGCQCMSYRVGTLEVIAGPSTPEHLRNDPFASGIPILFPWPGRIARARFDFAGRAVTLPANEPARGHAIHGLAWNCAYRVIRRGPYYLRAELDSSASPELSRVWPYRFRLELDYEIGGGLRCRAAVRNTGDAVMPFGFGAHPYFHAPLDPRGTRQSLRLSVPAAVSRWPLDESLIPVRAPEALAGKYDLRAPRTLGDESYDDAFRLGPGRDAQEPCARLIDPAARIAIELRADAPFGDLVVYAPAGRPVIALEPYTCAPDAFNLAARGIESGMRKLEPGESFEAGFEIRLSAP